MTAATIDSASLMLDEVIDQVGDHAHDELVPAVERVRRTSSLRSSGTSMPGSEPRARRRRVVADLFRARFRTSAGRAR